jgi:hypothetical protein
MIAEPTHRALGCQLADIEIEFFCSQEPMSRYLARCCRYALPLNNSVGHWAQWGLGNGTPLLSKPAWPYHTHPAGQRGLGLTGQPISISRASARTRSRTYKAPCTPVSDCEHHDPGDQFMGDLGTAVDWSAGFELGAALGVKGVNVKASFNGSAQTGYDANALMQFTFGRHHGGYLCGTNGTESTAAILVQRNNLP